MRTKKELLQDLYCCLEINSPCENCSFVGEEHCLENLEKEVAHFLLADQLDFTWSLDNLEIRPMKKLDGEHSFELVRWDDAHTTCITLAYFAHKEEVPNLVFVGARFFNHVPKLYYPQVMEKLAEVQVMLEEWVEYVK